MHDFGLEPPVDRDTGLQVSMFRGRRVARALGSRGCLGWYPRLHLAKLRSGLLGEATQEGFFAHIASARWKAPPHCFWTSTVTCSRCEGAPARSDLPRRATRSAPMFVGFRPSGKSWVPEHSLPRMDDLRSDLQLRPYLAGLDAAGNRDGSDVRDDLQLSPRLASCSAPDVVQLACTVGGSPGGLDIPWPLIVKTVQNKLGGRLPLEGQLEGSTVLLQGCVVQLG